MGLDNASSGFSTRPAKPDAAAFQAWAAREARYARLAGEDDDDDEEGE